MNSKNSKNLKTENSKFDSKAKYLIFRFVRFEKFSIRLIWKYFLNSKNSRKINLKNSRKINSKFVRFDSTPNMDNP